MQEETGVPGENLRDRVWIGNQTHLRTTWRSRGSNPVRSGERRVIRPLHQPDLYFVLFFFFNFRFSACLISLNRTVQSSWRPRNARTTQHLFKLLKLSSFWKKVLYISEKIPNMGWKLMTIFLDISAIPKKWHLCYKWKLCIQILLAIFLVQISNCFVL